MFIYNYSEITVSGEVVFKSMLGATGDQSIIKLTWKQKSCMNNSISFNNGLNKHTQFSTGWTEFCIPAIDCGRLHSNEQAEQISSHRSPQAFASKTYTFMCLGSHQQGNSHRKVSTQIFTWCLGRYEQSKHTCKSSLSKE